ncbi:hypothetical protein [Oryzifoliimicrobium ureilyticus]|uniref:hypothetical protein n=1 Tax=Oryzifoliimicrobium ureilyticus TaxID=3113724 RepID=UPI0030766CF3
MRSLPKAIIVAPSSATILKILASVFSDQGWVIEASDGKLAAVSIVTAKGKVELSLDLTHIAKEVERRLS